MSTVIRKAIERAKDYHVYARNLYYISPYYPDYIVKTEKDSIVDNRNVMYISTILRKKHEGKWYKEHHLKSRVINDETATHIKLRGDLMHHVYLSILFGKIDPEWRNGSGELLWELDSNQQSEEERLIKKNG